MPTQEAHYAIPPPPPSLGGQPAPAAPSYPPLSEWEIKRRDTPPVPSLQSWKEKSWLCRLGIHRWRPMLCHLGLRLRHCTRCGERHPDTYR